MGNALSLAGLDKVSPLAQVAIALGLGIVVLIIVQLVARRILHYVRSLDEGNLERRDQVITFIQVVQWVAAVLIVTAVMLTVMSVFIDIGPFLASVGLTGLVVSMATQAIFKDVISGAQILLENLYVVGDLVTIGDTTGTIERVTLRATYIRDFGGDLVSIPNGDVRTVRNKSRGWSRAIVDVSVAFEEDLDRVLAIIREVVDAYVADTERAEGLLDPPEVVGPLSMDSSGYNIRVMVRTEVGKQWRAGRELRTSLHQALLEHNVALPRSVVEIWDSNQTPTGRD